MAVPVILRMWLCAGKETAGRGDPNHHMRHGTSPLYMGRAIMNEGDQVPVSSHLEKPTLASTMSKKSSLIILASTTGPSILQSSIRQKFHSFFSPEHCFKMSTAAGESRGKKDLHVHHLTALSTYPSSTKISLRSPCGR